MDGDEQIKCTERVLPLDPGLRATPALAPLLRKLVETSLKSLGEVASRCTRGTSGLTRAAACMLLRALGREGAG
jgi:hypothetical protein